MNNKIEEFSNGLKELCEKLKVDFYINDEGIVIYESDDYNDKNIFLKISEPEITSARKSSINDIGRIINELKEELKNVQDDEVRKEIETHIEFLERNM